MRSILDFLISAYGEASKKDFPITISYEIYSEQTRLRMFLTVTSYLVFLGSTIMQSVIGKGIWIINISILSMALFMILTETSASADLSKKYKDRMKNHKEKLALLRGILRSFEFNLRSEKQIKSLIDCIDIELTFYDKLPKIGVVLNQLVTIIIMPITILLINFHQEVFKQPVVVAIIAILMLSLVIIVLFMHAIKLMISSIFPSYRAKLREMRDLLSDILIIDFQ